jgi:hypothetical protein
LTTKIITENELTADDFLSATDQAGGHIGQPVPDPDNTGSFTLVASGDIADTVYSGTATGDGAVGGTTVVDSLLSAYGDDFWIGATIEITSGAYNGETATVTDFAQATGTITFAALSGQIVTGVTFTMTLPYTTRDFRVELVTSGDAGTATFKWSHDGGTTYFGRSNPDTTTWLNLTEVLDGTAVADSRPLIFEKSTGGLMCIHMSDATAKEGSVLFSSDNGMTWGDEVKIEDSAFYDSFGIVGGVQLSTGRIYVWDGVANGGGFIQTFYSDNDGANWTLSSLGDSDTIYWDGIESSKGYLCRVYDLVYDMACIAVRMSISYSDGSWATIDVANSVDVMNMYPTVCETSYGNIVVAYASNEDDSVGEFSIYCKISTDGGATFGSRILIFDFSSGHNRYKPKLATDINGDLYCVAVDILASGQNIIMSRSTDGGATWGAEKIIATGSGDDLDSPYLTLINNTLFCAYENKTDGDIFLMRQGVYEVYAASGIPVPATIAPFTLTNNVGVTFIGGAGVTGDNWQFEPEYSFGMANIITHSPAHPFRTTTDNFDCAIVIDMGQYERFRATGVGFFGCNLRTIEFQMNATDSWATPSVDETITFDVGTGTVDAVSGNMVQDTAFLADYKDHFFSNKGKNERYYLRATSGIDEDVTYEIRDNVDGWFILETSDSISIAASDTFAVYQSFASKTFTGGNYRFIRILIEAQETSSGYYQIGSMVAGPAITLSRSWGVGYAKDIEFNIDLQKTASGGYNPVKVANRARNFNLTWKASEDAREEVVALAEFTEGKNLVLIPSTTSMMDCYLVKFDGVITQRQWFQNRFDTVVNLKEVL